MNDDALVASHTSVSMSLYFSFCLRSSISTCLSFSPYCSVCPLFVLFLSLCISKSLNVCLTLVSLSLFLALLSVFSWSISILLIVSVCFCSCLSCSSLLSLPMCISILLSPIVWLHNSLSLPLSISLSLPLSPFYFSLSLPLCFSLSLAPASRPEVLTGRNEYCTISDFAPHPSVPTSARSFNSRGG